QEKAEKIVLGMSTALDGPAANLGIHVKQGFDAAIYRVNQQGGIHGRELSLIAYDDGYEPKRTVPNMQRLIQEDKVLAVVGNVGTPTAVAAIPIAVQNSTLFYAAYTGAGVLRQDPPEKYVINYRASYAQEIRSMIEAFIRYKNIKPNQIAFFTQHDSYGDAGFNSGVKILQEHGLQETTRLIHMRYARNTLAVEDAVATLLLAEPAPLAVIMVGAYAPTAKFVKLVRENGAAPIFTSVSFVGSRPLAENLGKQGEGVIVTQVVPHYSSDLPIVHEYREDLYALEGTIPLSFGSLEGYIAGRILTRALQDLPAPPTRENMVSALEALGEFDPGLSTQLKLNSVKHQASDQVWPTVLREGRFVPFAWDELER
ncbi:MAG: ABC transporter substrate-binding protein, partial [Pseudomonadota bacterium]